MEKKALTVNIDNKEDALHNPLGTKVTITMPYIKKFIFLPCY